MTMPAASGIVALLLLVAIGVRVRLPPSPPIDLAIQSWVLTHQHPVAHGLFRWITILGGITGMRIVALAAAMLFLARRRWAVAAGLVAVPLLVVPVFDLLKSLFARPRPLGLGAGVDSDAAFPSGHATMAAAVCCAIAYALWRERVTGRGPALALAITVPLVVGISRVYLNVHWATDVLGGWCVGVLIAMPFAMLLDARSRAPGRSRS